MISKKYIKVENALIEVSQEVYTEYYRMERRERYQVERDLEKGTFSYDALDYEDMTGAELLQDPNQKSVEEQVETKLMLIELINAFKSLEDMEKKLIFDIYFHEKSLRILAKEWDVPLTTLFRRQKRILAKLKDMLE